MDYLVYLCDIGDGLDFSTSLASSSCIIEANEEDPEALATVFMPLLGWPQPLHLDFTTVNASKTAIDLFFATIFRSQIVTKMA